MYSEAIRKVVRERYNHQEIEEAVLADLTKHGTEDKILSGECTLPTKQDAIHWHQRNKYGAVLSHAELKRQQQIDELTAKVDALLAAQKGGQ